MDNIRRLFSSLLPHRQPSAPAGPAAPKAEPLSPLIAQYHQAESGEEKAELLDRIFAQFPRTLLLASVCFPEDDPSKPVYDRTLHTSPGAKGLYEENQSVFMKGNPGYRLRNRDGKKRLHLRTLVSRSSQQSWIPLFTDFEKYTPVFGIQTRVALFTISEVKAMCQPGQGILIDPGENALPLTAEDLKKIK